MSKRVLATGVCPKKGHAVAVLEVAANGHRVLRLPRLAVADLRGDGAGRNMRLGGDVIDLDDEGDEYRFDQRRAACACGRSFLVLPGDMLRAAARGTRRVVLRPRTSRR